MKKILTNMGLQIARASVIFTFLISISVQASYMKDVPVKLKQPDGAILNCLATGSEYHNWLHDASNYTIIKNPSTGYYVYATIISGKLSPSDFIVGQVNPATVGLKPGLNLSEAEVKAKTAALNAKRAAPASNSRIAAAAAPVRPATGVYNNLVIFISFSDQEEISVPLAEVKAKFNALGATSVRDFFKEVSTNQLDLVTSFYPVSSGTYPISYRDTHPRSYYTKDAPDGYNNTSPGSTAREHTLLANAVRSVQNQVPANLLIDGDNDGNIDNIVFVVNGYTEGWNELLWPHRWSLFSETAIINGKRANDYNIVFSEALGVGVICHELFHSFGSPDLYHYTDYPHTPSGDWDLMSSGDWTTPRHMTVYMKQRYANWVTSVPTLTAPGRYSLAPLSRSPYAAYRIDLPNTDQFLMVEYRKKEGRYESALGGEEGLIIYRINPAGNGNAYAPEELYIYRPGGTNGVDGNLDQAAFSENNNRTRFDDFTNPSCFLADGTPGGLDAYHGITNVSLAEDVISFDYNGGDNGNQLPVVEITNPKSTATITAPASFVIVANASDADGSITKVEFYNGTTLLGSDVSSPYGFFWQNVEAGTYTLTAKATDDAGATASSTVTITIQPAVSIADIIGNDCGQNGTTATYSLNPANRVSSTGYNWWYTGSVQSITPVANQPYNVVMVDGNYFSGGQLCVGVNYSVAPWYKQYCKNITVCPSNINAFRADEVKTVVSPNPSADIFKLTLKTTASLITVTNANGGVVKQVSNVSGTIELGNEFQDGIFTVFIHYTDNTTENIRLVKIK